MTAPNTKKDLRALASAIKFALNGMYQGKAPDFFFILVQPEENGLVTLNTITEVQSPRQIRMIGQHLIDMANSQEPLFDPEDPTEVRGHA